VDELNGEQISIGQPEGASGGMSMQSRAQVNRPKGIKSTKIDIGYFEIDAVFNGEPVELLEKCKLSPVHISNAATISQQRSTLSKQHWTLLAKTATMSN